MTKIIQLSDPHLGKDEDFRLAGVNTYDSFLSVLEHVRREEPELILATGDISADGELEAYDVFFDKVEKLGIDVIWLPGNHDGPQVMKSASQRHEYKKFHDIGKWRIFMMDSVMANTPEGEFGNEERAELRRLLAENTQPHSIVCMHHHPVPVNSEWLDKQVIRDAEQVRYTLEQDSTIRAVLWGHIHQEFEQIRGDVFYGSVPSTCIQFTPKSKDFALDPEATPGYRVIHIEDDGSFISEVVRVKNDNFQPDVTIGGY